MSNWQRLDDQTVGNLVDIYCKMISSRSVKHSVLQKEPKNFRCKSSICTEVLNRPIAMLKWMQGKRGRKSHTLAGDNISGLPVGFWQEITWFF